MELALIKKQYLGTDKVKKKTMRPSEKFRFNFDWEASNDSSRDLNPIYNNPVEAVCALIIYISFVMLQMIYFMLLTKQPWLSEFD